METNFFDSAKSLEGLAQFDQAAAASAQEFSANFITQVEALSASLQAMSDIPAFEVPAPAALHFPYSGMPRRGHNKVRP